MCRNGHNICPNCFNQLLRRTCPTCRVGFDDPPIRNRAVESLIADDQTLEFSCQEEGCPFTGTRKVLEDHEKNCDRRKVICPVKDCSTMKPPKQLVTHLIKKHPEVDGPHDKSIWFGIRSGIRPCVMQCDGLSLFFTLERKLDYGITVIYLKSIDYPETAKETKVKCTIKNDDIEEKFTKKITVPSVADHDNQKLFKEKKCYIIPNALLESFAENQDGNEEVSFEIQIAE